MDWGPPGWGWGGVGVMTLRASLTYPQSPAASPPQHPSSFLKPCTDLWTSVRTCVCSSGCRSVCFCFGCDLRLLSTRTQRKKKHSVVPPRLRVCVCELVCVCVQQIIPRVVGVVFFSSKQEICYQNMDGCASSPPLCTLWSTIKDVQCYFPRPSPL